MRNIASRAVFSDGGRNTPGRRCLCLLHSCLAPAKSLLTTAPITTAVAAAALFLQLQSTIQPACELWFSQLSVSCVPKLLTCHLLHWSWNHLIWDLAVFLVAGFICEPRWNRQFLLVLATAGLVIPLTVGVGHPQLMCYRGLSGIDSALFALAAGMVFLEEARLRHWPTATAAALVILGQFLKILAEHSAGHTLFVNDSGFTPIPLAHLAGALAGTGIASASWIASAGNHRH
jgi:rhomboid family GlyGly-CTERM serine protease